MIRSCAMAMLVLQAGCAPMGWIRTERGTDRIRTAFHIPTTLYGVTAKALILSNSDFPCSLPTEPDPDAITAAEQDYYMAWNREGTMLVGFVLFAWEDGAWEGSYPVDEAASPYSLDEVEPRAAMAGFRAVWEAQVSEDDGLYREYEPVVEEQVMPVEGPGTLEMYEKNSGYEGTFSLDTLDVSGNFRSAPCVSGGADLLDYFDLFDSSDPDDTTDTAVPANEEAP